MILSKDVIKERFLKNLATVWINKIMFIPKKCKIDEDDI